MQCLLDVMKFLENEYGLPTQDILLKTVCSIAPTERNQRVQWDSLTKFLSKTNLKLGGLNYEIRIRDEKLSGRFPKEFSLLS